MKRTKHLYKSFFALTEGESFFIRRGKLAKKTGFYSYEEPGKISGNCQEIRLGRIAPWRKVRTTQPVKLHPPSGILRNCSVNGPAVLKRPISDYEIHLRDPMDQDHTPEKTSDEQQRTL